MSSSPLYVFAAGVLVFVSHFVIDLFLAPVPDHETYELFANAFVAVPSAWIIFLLLRGESRKRIAALDAQWATEKQLSHLLVMAPDAVIGVHESGEIFLFNGAAELIFGYTAAEMAGKPLSMVLPVHAAEITPGRDLRTVTGAVAESSAEESYEVVACRKDQTRFPAEVSVSAIEEGGHHLFTIFLRDISWRKSVEEQLRRSNQELETRVNERTEQLRLEKDRLTRILDAVPDGICLIENDGRISYVNPALKREFGPIERRLCFEYFHDRCQGCTDSPAMQNLSDAIGREEWRSEVTGKVYERIRAPMRSSYSRLEILHDITEQRAAAVERLRLMREIDAQRSLFQAVVDHATVGIAIFKGKEFRVRWANSRYREILDDQLHDADLSGLRLEEILPGSAESGLEEIFHRVAATGRPHFDPEYPYVGAGHAKTYWQLHLLPLPVHGQEIPDLMVLATDVTGHVHARQKMEEMRNRAKAQTEELSDAYGELNTRTRELAALLVLSQKVASTLEIQPLLHLILDQLQAVFEFDGASILVAGEKGLTVAASRGARGGESAFQQAEELRDVISFNSAMKSRTPLIIDDLHKNERAAPALALLCSSGGGAPLEVSRSWMGVPMLFKDRQVGLLRLHRAEPGYFTPRHAELAMAIAGHAAVALENARLYRAARKLAVLEERQRLSRELHDSVSQALYGIALGAHTAAQIQGRDPEHLRKVVDYILKLADSAVAEMRFKIFEMRSDYLEREGLKSAITKLADAMISRGNFKLNLDLCEEPDVDPDHKEALYRLCHEALWNTARHARANIVNVCMRKSPTQLLLEVADDGIGFDPSLPFPGHLGIQSMRERAASMEGDLEITSAPSQGTRVVARLPLAI